MATNEAAKMKLQNELEEIQKDPPPFCAVALVQDDVFKWAVTINVPLESNHKDDSFELMLEFTENYPFYPPAVSFYFKWSLDHILVSIYLFILVHHLDLHCKIAKDELRKKYI